MSEISWDTRQYTCQEDMSLITYCDGHSIKNANLEESSLNLTNVLYFFFEDTKSNSIFKFSRDLKAGRARGVLSFKEMITDSEFALAYCNTLLEFSLPSDITK